MSYFKTLISKERFFYKNVSLFAIWDTDSKFTEHSEIRRFSKLKNSSVGKYSRVNPGCQLSNTTVKNFTAIGRDSTIGLGRHPLNYVSTQNIFYKTNNLNNSWVKPIDLPPLSITIGNDVWIGVEAMILDGVSIGDGAVIGARTVVTKDVPPYAIVVGQPGKIIKYRFDDETIKELLKINWWDFSDEKISDYIDFFREPNLDINVVKKYFS
jgi:acetyltransferase-like isoleucine patch superfamily enzyme